MKQADPSNVSLRAAEEAAPRCRKLADTDFGPTVEARFRSATAWPI